MTPGESEVFTFYNEIALQTGSFALLVVPETPIVGSR
jgi:hypothetical protein